MTIGKFFVGRAVGLAIILILLGAGYYYSLSRGENQIKEEQIREVNSFEECAEAGYPIMESYPEQCRTPDGRNFTKQIPEQPRPPVASPVVPPNNGNDDGANQVVCTMDAMQCPDGSYVGRTGPRCEFVCPSPSN